jgi:2-dehydro-3-deoxy-D-arabinonate dehydratase
MIIYKTHSGPVLKLDEKCFIIDVPNWDELLNKDDLPGWLRLQASKGIVTDGVTHQDLHPPIGTQEVWASGVTYFRSKTARMEESKDAGGATFYDKVYEADRPEIFFKATPQRVVGPHGILHRRKDSKWIVPEPELTLVINKTGKIVGYTCGNDLSCRDIEGENPLYLPQAKVFKNCAALGPGILIAEKPLADSTSIECDIIRDCEKVFSSATTLSQMKRDLEELVGWLFQEESFPVGCFMMTGTGIVPPDNFCLQTDDEVRIRIDGIGELVNRMD